MAKFWSLIQQGKRFPDPKVGEVMEYKSGERKKWAGTHGWVTFDKFNKLKEEGAFRLGQDYVRKAEQGYLQLGKDILSTVPSNVKEAVSNQAQVAAQGFVRDYQNLPENVQEGLEGVARTAIAPFQLLQKGIEKTSDITGIGTKPLDYLGLGAIEAGLTGGSSKLIRKGLQPGKELLQETGKLLDNRVVQAVSPDGSTINLPSSAVPLQSKGATLVGDKRRASDVIDLSPPGAPKGSGYKTLTEYPPISDLTGKKVAGSFTNVHHGGELSFQAKAIQTHKSFDTLKVGDRSPIVKLAESKHGVRSGNVKENLMDILATDISKGRQARITELSKQIDGALHKSTLNDLLRGSKEQLNLSELKPNQYSDLEAWKKRFPGEEYPGFTDKRSTIGKDKFPTINIKNNKGELIETWTPKSLEEYKNRFKIVSEKAGLNKTLDINAVKIDRTLDIFGGDHETVHSILNKFKVTNDGNPMFKLQNAIDTGVYKNLDVPQATQMFVDAHLFQEQVAAHVLKKRYGKVQELFTELYPNGYKGLGGTFDDLNKVQKQKFFRKHGSEIAVKGGIHEPILTMDKAKTAFEGWTPGMTDTFGWSPKKRYLKHTDKKTVQQALFDVWGIR